MKSLVLVTDAERPHALAVIRSLGRAGRAVCAASHDPGCASFRSRYTTEALHVPSPREEPGRFVGALLARLSRGDVALVIPVTELSLVPLLHARGEVERFAVFAAPEAAALERALDKAATVAVARDLGLDVPQTIQVRSVADLEPARGTLPLPWVLKARRSVTWEGPDRALRLSPPVRYARTWDEARRFVEENPGEWLCQERIVGEGVGLEGLYEGGRPLALFQHVRIRELPLSGGGSTCRRSEWLSASLAAQAERLFRRLRWTGVAMLELKRGGGRTAIVEINGRFWGSLPLSLAAGVDFPRLLAELLLDGRSEGCGFYRAGVSSIELRGDIEWAKAVLLRNGGGLPAVPPRARALDPLRNLASGSRLDLWAPDDLGATLHELREVASLALRSFHPWRLFDRPPATQ